MPQVMKKSWFQLLVIETLIPIILIGLTPIFMILYVHFTVELKSETKNIQGIASYLQQVYYEARFDDFQCWAVVLGFAIWSAIVPLCIGGKIFLGPPTISGFRPEYVDSGFRYFLISTGLLSVVLLSFPIGWPLYLKLLPLTCTTALFGLLCCFFFFIKGFVSPSPGEYTSTGNAIFDFYWGKELYPRIGRFWDLKLWTVVFYGMMGWWAIVLICWKAQYEHLGWNWPMATSTITLLIYMCKFFWWYFGYAHSLDIIHDRTGFYLGWGGLGLMPTFLACNAIYMVEVPSDLGPTICLGMTVIGAAFIFLTYWADMQRLWVREADGNCQVWGRPAKVIRATYKELGGKSKKSLILASGFWGVARHPNYVLELTANLMWMLPAKLDSVVPYLWFIFLLGIVAQRIGRDDNRCKKKYGHFWEEYCKIVPYRLIPGII